MMTPTERKTLGAGEVLRTIMDTNCNACDYDEAEGALLNHCEACCRKIVSGLHMRSMAEVKDLLAKTSLKRKRKK